MESAAKSCPDDELLPRNRLKKPVHRAEGVRVALIFSGGRTEQDSLVGRSLRTCDQTLNYPESPLTRPIKVQAQGSLSPLFASLTTDLH